MAIVALKTYFLVFALLAQALGYSPSTTSTRPTPRRGPIVQVPRQTQPRRTLSTFQSTFSLIESQLVTPIPTGIGNATFTITPAYEVNSLLSVCNSISPGFTTFRYENQTRCLCYLNTTLWQPEIFDVAFATCAQDVSATPSEYSQVASLEGFCLRSVASCNVSTTGPCKTSTLSGISSFTVGSPPPKPTQSSPTAGSGLGIQIRNADLTPGQKAGIGVGSFAVVSLAAFGLLAAVCTKKPAEVNDGGEESKNIPSPQDDTTNSGAEKALTLHESPKVHEIKLVVPRAMTL